MMDQGDFSALERVEIMRQVAFVMQKADRAIALAEGSLDSPPSCSKEALLKVEKSKPRPSLDFLRSRSPVKSGRRGLGENNPGPPFYKEKVKNDWSWSQIKIAQKRTPGVCRRLPGTCKPFIGRDGHFRVCKYSHPWMSE